MARRLSGLSHLLGESSQKTTKQIHGYRASSDIHVGLKRHARNQPEFGWHIHKMHCINAAASRVIRVNRLTIVIGSKCVIANPAYRSFCCAMLHIIKCIDLEDASVSRAHK